MAASGPRAGLPLEGAIIAFDLDGTLVDTAPDLIGTLNVLLADEGLPALPLTEARPFIGHGARWLIERGFQAAGAHLHPAKSQALFDRFIAHYRAHIADESRPFPGCAAALDALAAQGARSRSAPTSPPPCRSPCCEALGLARASPPSSAPTPPPPPSPTRAT
jgi:phosphoglycolate phosphatase